MERNQQIADTPSNDKGKKPKVVQNVKITALVDTSEVPNATDAAQSYTFTIQSGSFVSKAKAKVNSEYS